MEWKVRKLLEAAGGVVLRSAGSKGKADLVALWPEFSWALQVKAQKPTGAEVEDVRKASLHTEARWALVSQQNGRLVVQCWKKGKPWLISPPGLTTEAESPRTSAKPRKGRGQSDSEPKSGAA